MSKQATKFFNVTWPNDGSTMSLTPEVALGVRFGVTDDGKTRMTVEVPGVPVELEAKRNALLAAAYAAVKAEIVELKAISDATIDVKDLMGVSPPKNGAAKPNGKAKAKKARIVLSEADWVKILKECDAEKLTIVAIAKKHNVSPNTIYTHRNARDA